MKTCNRCGVERPVEDFPAHPMMADGHLKQCRECVKAASRARYLAKAEEIKAKVRAYREANKEVCNARAMAYHVAHRDAQIARMREAYWKNREENKAASRAYYRANKDRMLADAKAYRESPRGRAVMAKAQAREKVVHAEKIKARYHVANALRDRRLKRAERCEKCGAGGRVHAHHHKGYAPENVLNVLWLCLTCHKAADQALSHVA